MGELATRRAKTQERLNQLRSMLVEAESLASGKACVYATGSFGRQEASLHSDLDLFIVGKTEDGKGKVSKPGSSLSRLDEICIKAALIEVTRQAGIQDFSGEGRYLVHYSVEEFTKTLGTPEDDVTNTFTARLLLLLESCPLLESNVYREVIEEVIAAYRKDYEDHKTDFIPAFLGNDILRLWRTFCVNYEARTTRVPDEEKAKGKLKNYKLKHSRLLTCYSALLYLLAVHRENNTVSPGDAIRMVELTPTQRLDALLQKQRLGEAHATISRILEQYERFLEATNADEKELVGRFLNKETSKTYMTDAYKFGDLVFDAMASIGKAERFHRLLVV